MKKYKNQILVFFLILSFFGVGNLIYSKVHVKKIELTLVNTVGKSVLKYPGSPALGYNISSIDDNYLYVFDYHGEFPFYALDKKSLELKGFGSWGQGPGEITRGLPVTIGKTKSYLFVYLPMQSKLLFFNKDHNFVKEIRVQTDPGSIFYLIDDTKGIYVSSIPEEGGSKGFAEVSRLDESGKISPLFIYGEYKRYSQLNIFNKNPMLKKGPVHVDREGNIYFANYYSSLKMGYSSKGDILFIDFGQRKIEVPKAEIRKTKEGIITGDPERSIQCYLSLTSDDRYLYSLFSGEEITMEKIIAFRTGKGVELHLGEGKIIDIFTKKDGSYVSSFELPVFATSIAVDKDFLYVVSAEDEPCILIFRMSWRKE